MLILPRYIIQKHIAPFFFSLAIITFVFLLNFIVQFIGRVIGKGLPISVIFEYFYLNLAWMIALSTPMAVLISTLMAFGQLSSDNEDVAVKASGISLVRLILPTLFFASIIAIILIQFNNHVLPDFNHRARQLNGDILRKKPTFNLEEGIFNDDLPGYSILAEKISYLPENSPPIESPLSTNASNGSGDRLYNITIYDRGQIPLQRTIVAKEGILEFMPKQVKFKFTLFKGEIHEIDFTKPDDYRRLIFQVHTIYIPADGMMLNRRESSRRGDREMSAQMMQTAITRLETQITREKDKISRIMTPQLELIGYLFFMDNPVNAAGEFHQKNRKKTEVQILQNVNQKQQRIAENIKSHQYNIRSYRKKIDVFLVEIHKKYSIPIACLVFVLIGAPLGIIARRGNLAVSGGISLGFFVIFWAFLIGGEELADRQFIPPWLAMWAANILVGSIGLYFVFKIIQESSFIQWVHLTFTKKIS